MLIVRNIATRALALCSVVSDVFHHASPVLVTSIAEQGHLGNAGYAALLTLHVTGVVMSGSSRAPFNDTSSVDVMALYTICPSYGSSTTNITQPSDHPDPSSVVQTVLPYSGTKALALYDNRRQVSVYDRGPQELTVYTTPIDLTQLWVDTRPHKLAYLGHLPLLGDDTRLFKAYIERRSVLLAIIKATEDPVELVQRRDCRSLGSTSAHPRCERVASRKAGVATISRKLVLLHVVWLLVVLGCIMCPDESEACGSTDSPCPIARPDRPCKRSTSNPAGPTLSGKSNKNRRKNRNRRNRGGVVSVG